jgi:hypothetical protein
MLRLPLIFLCITSLVSVAQAADMVVIHSNDTQLFPIGQLFDSHTPINLPAETDITITVIFSSGGVQTISGPYQGTLQDPLTDKNLDDNTLVTVLAKFLTETEIKNLDDNILVTVLAKFLTETEIVRGLSQPPENLWLIDVSTHKRFYCVAPSKRVILWRPKSQSDSASTLLIKHKTTGQQVSVVWPAYQTTLRWPRNLPVIYGDTYTVELKTRSRTSFKKLVLYQLPESLPTNSHKVVWMVGRGCIPQANILLTSLR